MRLWSFELMPTASIVSIKHEICNLKCKFKTVDGILMFWKQSSGTQHEVIHPGIPEGSLSQTSRQVCLTLHCLCGKTFKLSITHKIEFVECYLQFASYFVNGPTYKTFSRHYLTFPLPYLLI